MKFSKIIIIVLLLFTVLALCFFLNSEKKNSTDETNIGQNDIQENNVEEKSAIEEAFLLRNGEKIESLPILMYHFFYDESAGETGHDSNWMEISDFEEQMKYLSEENFYFPTWDEVYEFVKGTIDLPLKSIVVTADDGDESFFRLAVPILNKYNINATSFIVTSWTGTDTINEYNSNLLNFQSHSHDMHRPGSDGKGAFLTMTHDEALTDLETAKNIIGSNDAFCYPFGHTSSFTHEMLEETEFKVGVTTKSGRATPGMDVLELPRVRMSKGDSLTGFINRVN